ncbi:MAG: SagB/ThcOx family dehydrogenase [Planctomycetota bacterium]|nr:MAG: SagB/ThcOx family dehydrogenase [Planctomycetota bacterium]
MSAAPRGTVPIELPKPKLKGKVSVEEAIANRRSRRKYGNRAMTLAEVGQVLWSGLGITGTSDNFKASPSAGAMHPLDLFAAVAPGAVEGLTPGFYRYREKKHHLIKLSDDNFIPGVADKAYGQGCVAGAPVLLVVTVEYGRTTSRYRERGRRYAHMDVGHMGENIYLQAEALGLATVAIGAFDDDAITNLLPLPKNYEVKYLFPIGPMK